MGSVKVMIDDTNLDNGSTRLIVGHPYILSDSAGKIHEFNCEFILQGTTASAFDTLFDSTFDDLELLNPRLRYWQDDSKATPTLDWHYGDGKHTDLVSSVQILADESRTQRKIHCLFRVVAMKHLDLSTNAPPATGSSLTGLAGKIEVTRVYLDSERYTLSCGGVFKSTLNSSVEGPYNLASVSSNSGKARFTLESPDVITAAYSAALGQFVDVSAPSAYQGRHFISGISGGGAIIDTTTAYVSAEGDVNATVLYGTTTTAEANFSAAKDVICRTILETGDNGSPNSSAPHMCKISESIAYSSEKKDMLDFVMASTPGPMATTVSDSNGDSVERGLAFTVKYIPPDFWNEGHAGMVWGVVIQGKTAISNQARIDNSDLAYWFNSIKLQILAEVEPTITSRLGGGFRERACEYEVDWATNDVTFTIMGDGNYNGTLNYKRTDSTHTRQPRTIFRNTDGTMPVQTPKGAPDVTKVIRIEWMGEAGAVPPSPPKPSESGFEYLFQEASVVQEENITDPNGNTFEQRTTDYTYIRVKPVSSGGGLGAQSGGGDPFKEVYDKPTA